MLSFRIERWMTWRPSVDTAAPVVAGMPSSLRRRVTPIGRRALEAAWHIEPPATARLIFSSRHGEYDRTLSLLTGLATERTVSPADFSLSVHPALAGLFSIAAGNRTGISAIAAGPESFGYGLLEGAASAATSGETVCIVHYDAPLPKPYDEILVGDETEIAAAFVLGSGSGGERVSMELGPGEAGDPPSASLAGNFVEFLASGESERRVRGPRMRWHWRRDA